MRAWPRFWPMERSHVRRAVPRLRAQPVTSRPRASLAHGEGVAHMCRPGTCGARPSSLFRTAARAQTACPRRDTPSSTRGRIGLPAVKSLAPPRRSATRLANNAATDAIGRLADPANPNDRATQCANDANTAPRPSPWTPDPHAVSACVPRQCRRKYLSRPGHSPRLDAELSDHAVVSSSTPHSVHSPRAHLHPPAMAARQPSNPHTAQAACRSDLNPPCTASGHSTRPLFSVGRHLSYNAPPADDPRRQGLVASSTVRSPPPATHNASLAHTLATRGCPLGVHPRPRSMHRNQSVLRRRYMPVHVLHRSGVRTSPA